MGLVAILGTTLGSAAYADGGGINFNVFKAGFVFGGSAGSGTLFSMVDDTGWQSAA